MCFFREKCPNSAKIQGAWCKMKFIYLAKFPPQFFKLKNLLCTPCISNIRSHTSRWIIESKVASNMVFGSATKFSNFYHMLLVVVFCFFDHSFGSSNGSSNSSIKDLTSQPLKVVELIEYWGYGMNYLLQNAIFFFTDFFWWVTSSSCINGFFS